MVHCNLVSTVRCHKNICNAPLTCAQHPILGQLVHILPTENLPNHSSFFWEEPVMIRASLKGCPFQMMWLLCRHQGLLVFPDVLLLDRYCFMWKVINWIMLLSFYKTATRQILILLLKKWPQNISMVETFVYRQLNDVPFIASFSFTKISKSWISQMNRKPATGEVCVVCLIPGVETQEQLEQNLNLSVV